MIKEEQNPVGPVLTAAESRRRVLHNMCSSLLYNLSVILFGLLCLLYTSDAADE